VEEKGKESVVSCEGGGGGGTEEEEERLVVKEDGLGCAAGVLIKQKRLFSPSR
jgi:hypothetical protein